MTSSVLSSQSVILTTAMAVSGAVIFLSLCRNKNFPNTHQNSVPHSSNLRSCLTSDDKRGENKKKKKNKRVKFADDVKDENTEFNPITSAKKERKVHNFENKKISAFHQMPANRAALYQGILRDRIHRVESCY